MKLSGKEKVSYGLGAVGKDMVYMLSASYILYYYQDLLGVKAAVMGTILMIARIFDAFNDPIMGVIVAKTKTKWGRFRPWLLIGTVTNAIILFFMFACPPSLSGGGLVAYAAATYILWGVTYTMMDIPFWSMIPAFTESGKEREGLTTLARSCAGVGSALVTILTVQCVAMIGKVNQAKDAAKIAIEATLRSEGVLENSDAWTTRVNAALAEASKGAEITGFKWFTLVIAILFILFTVFACITIKEKSTVDVKSASVGEMFRALLRNDQAVTVVATIVLINCSLYITSNLVIYFFKYDFVRGTDLDWSGYYTLFNAFGGGIQILSMMILYPLLRKSLSNLAIFRLSFGLAIGGYAVLFGLFFVGKANIILLLIPAFFIFAAFGMLTVLTTVFLANTVDYGELKNGSRDESVIFSMQTFVVKLASGVAVLLASLCLTFAKLSEDTEAVAATASNSSVVILRVFMTVLPIVGMLIAFAIFQKKYILTDEKLEEIGQKLKG